MDLTWSICAYAVAVWLFPWSCINIFIGRTHLSQAQAIVWTHRRAKTGIIIRELLEPAQIRVQHQKNPWSLKTTVQSCVDSILHNWQQPATTSNIAVWDISHPVPTPPSTNDNPSYIMHILYPIQYRLLDLHLTLHTHSMWPVHDIH